MVLGNDGSSAARCEKLGVPASISCRVRQVRGFGAVGDGGASQDCESGEPTPEPMGSRAGHLDGDLQRRTAQRGFRGVGGGLCSKEDDRFGEIVPC